ncbi:zinc-binding alcohol dehydrogenase family protein [Saccharopolyspora taberi]|uniref:Zinc-binding alcohol dehydrogenase family protein n=1 Tax=Saccharopolyspora taberi TaxID=60895 RepID=A0ABN3VQR0_9PSEU
MRAAIVRSFTRSPRYEEFDDPVAADDEVVLKVVAAGLHPSVRACGRLATPFIPGSDGVGRMPGGSRVFFAGLEAPSGSMAERAVVRAQDCVPIPDDVDDVTVAASVHPAMPAWLALRSAFEPGESVLVLGATGNAGRMAVQIARLLGAGRVVAAGRNKAMLDRLLELGVDEVVALDRADESAGQALADAASDVDVVLDFLWGRPAEIALDSLAGGRRLRWVRAGTAAGARMGRSVEALSDLGVEFSTVESRSLPPQERLAELTALINRLPAADLTVHAVSIPLHAVESAWRADSTTGARIVLVP